MAGISLQILQTEVISPRPQTKHKSQNQVYSSGSQPFRVPHIWLSGSFGHIKTVILKVWGSSPTASFINTSVVCCNLLCNAVIYHKGCRLQNYNPHTNKNCTVTDGFLYRTVFFPKIPEMHWNASKGRSK